MNNGTLSLRTKLFYSANGLGEAALLQGMSVWLLYYYAPPEEAGRATLLSLFTVSALLCIGRLLEAFDDAFFGWLSDRTTSRWGRRVPYILLASPFWALFAYLLFAPPQGSTVLTALWFFGIFQLYSACGTLANGPYEALLPELARSSADRISLATISVYLGVAGAGIGLIGSGLLRDLFGFQVMAAALALWALAWRYVGLFGVWRKVSRPQPPATLPFKTALRTTFRNRHFQLFLPTFVLFNIGFSLMLGVLPYYVNAVLKVEQEGTWVALFTAIAIVSLLAATPYFAQLARRTSKAQAYTRAMLLAAGIFPIFAVAGMLPVLPEAVQIAMAMALAGVPLAGIYLFPAALTADICDDDARAHNARREATFYGVQNWVEKSAGALSPLLLGGVLLLGNSSTQPLGVRIVGPLAGLIVLSGALVFRHYTLVEDAPSVATGHS